MRPWVALAAAVLLLACHVNAGSSACGIQAWQPIIEASCLAPSISHAAEVVINASACEAELEPQILRVYTPYNVVAPMLDAGVGLYMEKQGSYNATVLHASEWMYLNVTEAVSRDILGYYDAFVVDAEVLPELAQAGAVAPLDALVAQPDLNWFRIHRYYRGFSVLYDRKTYGIPLSGVGVATFYRKDLFDALNLSVPVTWDEVLDLAQRWGKENATDLNGDDQIEYGFCMRLNGLCIQSTLLGIVAPLIQNNGPSSGVLIDPASGNVLLNSSAFVEALSMWQKLASLGPPDGSNPDCLEGYDAFAEGRCLMTVQLIASFKRYAGSNSTIRDKLGVSMPPGSARVLNRTSGLMEDCTPALCPLGTYKEVHVPGGNATNKLVNDAPVMYGGLVGAVSSRNPAAVQAQLVQYFAEMSSTLGLRNVLTEKYISPFRVDHWSAAAVANWTGAGYGTNATNDLLAVLKQLYGSSNLAPPLRLKGQYNVQGLLAAAATESLVMLDPADGSSLIARNPPAEVASALQAAVQAVLEKYYPRLSNGTLGYLELYRQQIGYTQPDVAPPSPAPPADKTSSGVSRQTVVVISVVMGLVALVAGVVALEVRNKRRHKDLLGRVKPPLGDPDTTIVMASIQDFDELWEALISDASERALQQFIDLVDLLLRRHSGYRGAGEEEDVVVAFHCPRDACEFALELQRGLLELRWPRHVLEMEQFRPHYLTQTRKGASFSQNCNGNKSPMSPLAPGPVPNEDEDKLFALDAGTENVHSFGEQCVASWSPADPATPDAELVFCGIRARVGLCAVGFSRLVLDLEPGRRRYTFSGEAVEVAAAAAAAAQGGMVLIPQSTFRQLHLEVLADQCLFCHLGEYQLTSELPPMDLYLALDRQLLGRLALFGPLACHMQWSQGAFAAPVHSASMVFTHVVGVQTLLAWNYDLMQDVIETFTKLAQVELQQAGGYLVEHVEGFMLTAFHSPADAILWGLRMQELMLKEDWPEELLAHELCEEVTVTVPVRGGEVTSATVFRGPRLKTGIDIGQVLARLHTMTGRMTYRGKVMNRAARISAAASSGQVLCSAEAWESCTASASALRLVSATSLGLFQLKGIQERIEVFHCTYQRHMASSTRRSSTVSVGLVSSSDNRRKSALVLSSHSHITSHHTTSYRTSMHNSTALEQVSASDGIGGRRGSTTSSALPVARGSSLGAGQLSGMLQTVGIESTPAATAAGGVFVGMGRGSSPGPHRAGVGGGSSAGNGSQQSQGSGNGGGSGSGAGGGAGGGRSGGPITSIARAALAAVLQSRTRSASSIRPSLHVLPFRSHSARARQLLPQTASAATSAAATDPQASVPLDTAGVEAAAPAATPAGSSAVLALQQRYMVTSPSMSPSLAMAAAAAAAASCEKTHSSPKTAASLDLNPRGAGGFGSGIGSLGGGDGSDGSAHQAHMSLGTGGEGVSAVRAAVYAVLPSVVLSSSVATAGHTNSSPNSGVSIGMSYATDSRSAAGAGTAAAAGRRSSVVAHSDGEGATRELQYRVGGPASYTASDVAARDDGRGGADDDRGATGQVQAQVPSATPFNTAPGMQPANSADTSSQRKLQRPMQLGRMLMAPAGTSPTQVQRPPPSLAQVPVEMSLRVSGESGDDGSRVETLDVTLSATGLVRAPLSGGNSSVTFANVPGSSQAASCMSRSGSATATGGMSYFAMAMAGATGNSPSPDGVPITRASGGSGGEGVVAASAASHASSGMSSGPGPLSFLTRPQSAAGGRGSLSLSASPVVHCHPPVPPPPTATSPVVPASGTAAATAEGVPGTKQAAAVTGRPGSGNSVDLFLPFPLEAAGGAAGGGASSYNPPSGMALLMATNAATATAGALLAAPCSDSSGDSCSGRVAGHRMKDDTSSSGLAIATAALPPPLSPRQDGTAGTPNTKRVVAAAAGAAAAFATDRKPSADIAGATAAAAGAEATATLGTSAHVLVDADGPRCAHGAGASSDVSSSGGPESRSNSASAVAAVAIAAAAAAAEVRPTGNPLRDELVGGGSLGRGGLRPNNRTGSGVSNDLMSHVASPSYTCWTSGGSMTSTANMIGGGSVTSLTATTSVGGQQVLPTGNSTSLRVLSGASGEADGEGRTFAVSGGVAMDAASCSAGHDTQGDAGPPTPLEAAAAGEGVGASAAATGGNVGCGAAAGHRLRSVGMPVCDGSGDGSDGMAGAGRGAASSFAFASAMAAAFGVGPTCDGYGTNAAAASDLAAAAAVFGVGPPPVVQYGAGGGVGDSSRLVGPTAEELERALELLGESRHAGGGGWH